MKVSTGGPYITDHFYMKTLRSHEHMIYGFLRQRSGFLLDNHIYISLRKLNNFIYCASTHFQPHVHVLFMW